MQNILYFLCNLGWNVNSTYSLDQEGVALLGWISLNIETELLFYLWWGFARGSLSSADVGRRKQDSVRIQNEGYINVKYTPPHHKCVIGEFVPVEKMLQKVRALIAGVAPRHRWTHRTHLHNNTHKKRVFSSELKSNLHLIT